ncbi:MAG: hypothetical protein HQL43_12770 [Alphaproteobacteria bacterium]|nr:hypothetical protein [Alphaproteobacteria bacterium]
MNEQPASITLHLKENLKGWIENLAMSPSYSRPLGAYIEVLQYSQIVKDARLRHEAFFKQLGIS